MTVVRIQSFKDHFTVKPLLVIQSALGLERGAGTDRNSRTIRFTSKAIKMLTNNMQRRKSPGHGGLSIEHFKYVGVYVPRVFTRSLNFMYWPFLTSRGSHEEDCCATGQDKNKTG